MSGLTGYLTNSGVDLSFIFQSRTSAPIENTGYISSINNLDLSALFEPYTSGTKSVETGYIYLNNDLNSIFAKINTPQIVTIGGSGTYSRSPSGTTFTSGTTYKYTFTGGGNTFVSNFTIETMYVIVVGAGGGGAYAAPANNLNGGGGAGGGSGALTMFYTDNTTFNISVALQPGAGGLGGNSSFKNSDNTLGVTSTGGTGGNRTAGVNAAAGTSSNNFTTFISFVSHTGGYGGSRDSGGLGINGGNSGSTTNSLITVSGTSYKYGGGGRGGNASYGGRAGLNGIGATLANGTNTFGQSATTPGSGGGGASISAGSNSNSLGSRGEVVIIFTL